MPALPRAGPNLSSLAARPAERFAYNNALANLSTIASRRFYIAPDLILGLWIDAASDPEARADATSVHTRDEVPIAWALPLGAREERAGRFWAFFPTETPSRVPAILNAPWKVNSDRTALIHGSYNAFLMQSAAKLVVSALAPLCAGQLGHHARSLSLALRQQIVEAGPPPCHRQNANDESPPARSPPCIPPHQSFLAPAERWIGEHDVHRGGEVFQRREQLPVDEGQKLLAGDALGVRWGAARIIETPR
jgi:hypothetical protein